MISEIILGLVSPAILFYKGLPCVQSFCDSVFNGLNLLSKTYLSILSEVQSEYKDSLVLQLLAPCISLYKLSVFMVYSSHSYFTYYFNNKNIVTFDHFNIVSYTLHGKKYNIILNRKQKSLHSILSVYGYYLTNDKNSLDDVIGLNWEHENCTNEVEADSESEQKVNDEAVDEEENEAEAEVEEENEAEAKVEESEQNEEENKADEAEDEDEEEVEEDITEFFNSIYGPCKDFHQSKISPNMLGYEKIIIKYLNGDTVEEEEKTFIYDEIIVLN